MINYEEELKKFTPSLEVGDMSDSISKENMTDLTDMLHDIMVQVGMLRR